MASVPLDRFSGLLAADAIPLLPPASGPDAAGGESFDRHLQRARESAEQGQPPAAPSHTSSDAAGDRGSSPMPPKATSSGPATAAGEQSQRKPERAEEERRDRTEDNDPQDAAATAAAPADAGAAASADDAAGREGPREASASHEGKTSPATNQVKGKAQPSQPQSPASNAAGPTESNQGQPTATSEAIGREALAEQPAGGSQDETPPAAAAGRPRPGKLPAKTGPGTAAGVEQPTAKGEPWGTAAGESARAAAEMLGPSGPTPTAAISRKRQPAGREAQATATAPRRGGSRPISRAAGEGGSTAGESPAGVATKPAAAAPEKSGDLRQPAPPATAAAAIDAEPDRGETADAKDKGGSPQVDSPTSRQAPPRATAASSADAQGAAGQEQAERVRFVGRVARAFEAAANRGGPIRLRLHPPELGALRLELSIRRGAVTARIEAETEAAQKMLLDHLAELRQRLAEHQLRVERFDVEWTGRSPGDLLQQPGGSFPGPARQGNPAPRTGAAPERQGPVPAASPPRARTVHPASFDVII